MFAPLGPGAIGHVVIDEAGQATPQAAAGLLMRASRALIIRDQRQLEPISVLPGHLERHIGRALPSSLLRRMSPLTSSVQGLADHQSRFGTYLGEGDERVWIGIPLCMHRRCEEPMFSSSNSIAYENFMIYATPQRTGVPLLGESAWYHVEGLE